jgi:glycosyltransferase involved in cell wall biosynthesis
MAALAPPDQLRVYFNAPRPPADLRFPGAAVPLPSRRFWTLRTLAQEMRRDPPDVLFVPSHVIPPAHPKSVVTIHDLGYLTEPNCHEPKHRLQLEWTTRWNCRAASGIISVSESTRRDLIDLLDVSPEKILVIPHGVSPRFEPASPEAVSHLKAAHDLPDRIVLAVGTIHPRKNLMRLIQAFEMLAADDSEIALVLCGAPGWRASDILERARRSPFARRIHNLGFIRDNELPALYSAAAVTAFVSLHEGFGLPALESMACGTPVVAADRTSLPEVCGDAAILIDPFDSHEIAGGLRRVLDDSSLRRRLAEQGRSHAKAFTWQRCARDTLAFLRAIRDNSG